jgi:CRP-like cAMP-binding protein
MLFAGERNPIELAAGDVLFSVGDPGDTMFAVVDGEIDVGIDGAVIEKIGVGGILGELSLIDEAPRSAGAVAAVPTKIARVDRHRFTFLVREHPTFALQVMSVMAARLRRNMPPSHAEA